MVVAAASERVRTVQMRLLAFPDLLPGRAESGEGGGTLAGPQDQAGERAVLDPEVADDDAMLLDTDERWAPAGRPGLQQLLVSVDDPIANDPQVRHVACLGENCTVDSSAQWSSSSRAVLNRSALWRASIVFSMWSAARIAQ